MIPYNLNQGLHDYKDKIKYPMDILTISNRLESGWYIENEDNNSNSNNSRNNNDSLKSLIKHDLKYLLQDPNPGVMHGGISSFADDVRLIFSNCVKYNTKGSPLGILNLIK